MASSAKPESMMGSCRTRQTSTQSVRSFPPWSSLWSAQPGAAGCNKRPLHHCGSFQESADTVIQSSMYVWFPSTQPPGPILQLPMSATAMSPFQCIYVYEPPPFPSEEISVPSFQAQVCRCHKAWNHARSALLGAS